MSGTFARRTGTKPVRWNTLLGLVLVPLTIAGVFIWGLWNPTDRLGEVTAAVVNLDEPVEVDGQLVPLGRVLAGELVGDATPVETDGGDGEPVNFTWVLTNEDDAAAGLDEGRYATVVTIPENFSAAATSLAVDPEQPEQAHIDIAGSDRSRLLDTALSGIVTQTAASVLNQQLGEQFVSGVFVGMTELRSGLGEAADGADELAGGSRQLAGGAGELATGTQQLADGTQQLSAGAGELAAGAGELATGAGQLATGASGFAGGTAELANGMSDLAGGLRVFVSGDGTPENPGLNGYAAGMRTLVSGNGTAENPGLEGYLGGVDQYASGVGEALVAVRDGLQLGANQITTYREGIASGAIPPPEGVDVDIMLLVLDGLIEQMQSEEAQQSVAQLDGLIATSGGIAEGARAYGGQVESVASGAEALAVGGEQLAGGAAALSGGAAELSNGAVQLWQGTSALSGGVSQLSAGASGLATGTSELAANTPALADGASQLADGASQAATGSHELARGLGEAVTGIPAYTEAQRDRIAETAITPVETRGSGDEFFSAGGVSLFAGVALWAGALAVFLMFAPLWSRTREAARSVPWIALRSAAPAVALGALQGALAGVVLPIALGYTFSQGTAFFGLALLAGIAFALTVQGLAALFGGVGRFIAFALLVVVFTVGVVSTVPAPLVAVGDASPVGVALAGFQAIASGASGAGGAALILVLWGLGGLLLTTFAVGRARARE